MNATQALMSVKHNLILKVNNGKRWMVYHRDEWVVYEQQRRTVVLIATKSESEAIAKLLEDDDELR